MESSPRGWYLVGIVPIHSNSIIIQSLSQNLLATFAAYRLYLHVHAFAVSAWAFTTFRDSDNCGYFLSMLLQYGILAVTSMPQNNGHQDGALVLPVDKSMSQEEPYTAKGSPRSLAIWGLGGPHITSDLSPGGPISRGGPYRRGAHIALTPGWPCLANK